MAQSRDGVPEGVPVPERIGEIARLAVEAGAPEIAADAEQLAHRLAEGRFYVACVGQFKRGKSTLLNALVARPLLPVGVVPITTALTVLRYDEGVRARVRLAGEWREIATNELAAYVSEETNPANVKGVELVEVFVPSPLLASGLCLVDTPGIGSVIEANTAATKAFVPHIDAALVVIGADPPISGEEMRLIEQVAKQVDDLVFVLNKADRLSAAERTEAITFARKVLAERLGKLVGPIYEVSATERLSGDHSARDWPALEQALEHLGKRAGANLVRRAEARGAALLTGRLLHEIGEQRDALLRPVAASEERIRLLRGCVTDAEMALNDLGYLLTAEQERLHRTFAEQCQHFLAAVHRTARPEFLARVGELHGGRAAVRQQAFGLAREMAIEVVDRWLAEAGPAAEQLYRDAAERFARLANEFLERVASSAEGLTGLPRTVTPDLGFRAPSRLYYTDLMFLTSRSPLRWLLDGVRSPPRVRGAMERDVLDYLERLLTSNANRIMNDLDERVRESRRRLEGEIRGYLRDVALSAERALDRARARQAAGRQTIEAEIMRLDQVSQRIAALRPNTPQVPE